MTELTLRDYTHEIEGMLERNAYDEAVAHCRFILQQYPKCVQVYRLLGKMAFDRADDEHAADLFARVLSADPSDFVSRAGLAIINDRQDSLPDAMWHMERAYELEPGNPVIQAELRKLYGRRDGAEPQRIPLTRGALARLYMNGELYSEAVAELRTMLAQEPDRVDLQVLLTEALWRDEQKLEASDVALKVLDKMPFCLDANLILGEIWMSGGREEDADVPLKRAMALDPEGVRAAMLFGKSSPIPARPVQVMPLEYIPPVQEAVTEEAPEWLVGLGAPAEATVGGAEEVPAWLQGLGLPSPEAPVAQVAPPEIGAPPVLATPTLIEAAPVTEGEQVPDWLSQLRAEVAPLPPSEAALEEAATPDWLLALKPSAAEQPAPKVEEAEEGVPDWLAQLRAQVAPLPTVEAQVAPREELAAPEEVEFPDWLAQLRAQAAPVSEAEVVVEEPLAAPEPAEIPDWLRALEPEGVEAAALAEELPEWLSAFPAEPIAAEPVEAAPVAAEEQPAVPPPPQVEAPKPAAEEQPAWLTGEGAMPSPEEAMAFFAKLSAGKEAESQAQAQAEAEERMASIMGRKPEVAPAQVPQPAEKAPTMPEWPVEPEIELAPEAHIEAAAAPQVPAGWAVWAEVATTEEALPVPEPEVVEGLMAGLPAPEIAAGTIVEQVPVEAAPAARVPVAEAIGPDWWYQTLADEEAPVEEVPSKEVVPLAEAISVAAPSPVKEPVPVPAAPGVMLPPTPMAPAQPTLAPSPPPEPKLAARPPKRLVRTKPMPALPPKPAVDMESIMARLRANPDDHGALLDMGRGHAQLGDLHAAHGTYEELVRRNVLVDDVISDLEKTVEDNPDHVDFIRLLGDAHMKSGNLQKALKLYRQALKKL